MKEVPIWEKSNLTLEETAAYSGIGINKLRLLTEKEEQIAVDSHDGIRTETRMVTVNEMFDLWCDLKRGIKDNTFQNYKYMYNMFVRSGFDKLRIITVKRTDVKRFYNKLADGQILKVSTIDTIHNLLH